MLVLSRKIGERIVIGGNIVVTIVGQQGDRVKLGFDAPPEVSIHRQEIHERIADERATAIDYRQSPSANSVLASHGSVLAFEI